MFKWLFKDKRKEFSNTIYPEYRKKNIFGITKIYESYNLEYDWLHIIIKSHENDDGIALIDSGNILDIGFGHWHGIYLLPFKVVKPVLDYHYYKKDNNGKDTDEISWSQWEEKEYGVSYISFKNEDERCFHFKIGYVDSLMNNITKHKDRSIWITLFWTNCDRSSHILMDTVKNKIIEINDMKWELRTKHTKEQPKLQVAVRDYDGEELIATLSVSQSIYTYGGKRTKWLMKLFKAPLVFTNLDMEFSRGIGKGKGGWKGGTIGQGIHFTDNSETILQAFNRYCTDPEVRGFRSSNDFNLTMVEVITDDNREKYAELLKEVRDD